MARSVVRAATRQKFRGTEDLSGQAGWMFADLLLALTVVFLATVSFVPQKTSLIDLAGVTTKQTIVEPSVIISKTSITLTSTDEMTLLMDLQNYGSLQHLPAQYVVSGVTIAGGYNSATQSPDQGTATALRYASAIASYNLPYFKNTSTVLASDSSIPAGSAVLNLTIQSKK